MDRNDPLAEPFKATEAAYRLTLPSHSIVGIRLDGRAFGSFTRAFERPYSDVFMDAMDTAATRVIRDAVSGVLFGYAQSDEITVFFTDRFSQVSALPFGGRVEKILSVAAAVASTSLAATLAAHTTALPAFDARVAVVGGLDEVAAYLTWRRLDARRNAVTMAAERVVPRRRLHGMSTPARRAALTGTAYEVLPDGFLNGRLIVPEPREEQVTWTHRRTGEITTQTVTRTAWVSRPATGAATDATLRAASERLGAPEPWQATSDLPPSAAPMPGDHCG